MKELRVLSPLRTAEEFVNAIRRRWQSHPKQVNVARFVFKSGLSENTSIVNAPVRVLCLSSSLSKSELK